jgi:hypothetical protein
MRICMSTMTVDGLGQRQGVTPAMSRNGGRQRRNVVGIEGVTWDGAQEYTHPAVASLKRN